jgi:hypothetical protein
MKKKKSFQTVEEQEKQLMMFVLLLCLSLFHPCCSAKSLRARMWPSAARRSGRRPGRTRWTVRARAWDTTPSPTVNAQTHKKNKRHSKKNREKEKERIIIDEWTLFVLYISTITINFLRQCGVSFKTTKWKLKNKEKSKQTYRAKMFCCFCLRCFFGHGYWTNKNNKFISKINFEGT